MSFLMGIDIGSGTSKGVLLSSGEMKAWHQIPSGVNYRQAAEKLRTELLAKLGLHPEDISATAVTGHGAANVPFSNRHVVDIRCCARGIHHIFPGVRTVIDIQGQSSQVIRLNETGQVIDFAASEKCASGSGRFLDIIANVLQVDIRDIADIASRSAHPITFTTGCAVFGESEAVSRVAEGIPREDILAGVLEALAGRISSLVDRVGLEKDCSISGGGALNGGLVRSIEKKLGVSLLLPPQPQIVNALGAAIIAGEQPE
jgi:(R)-2-hydroxyacyl-CoA dehydratese activating ATPase